MSYTISKETTGFFVTDSNGEKRQFAKLWLALSWVEKQF